ncbi:ABC transporter permease [Salinisphaera sp. Q1T1-3]|uniref:ABC transporter permease n=1 Tax=Salinisphaera sp. Q1T1-3 TaxID=2321229 RepID=UPI000E7087DD|nr:ABC transporter permease subunit [Salinisphaera sp. Q1T1-3]RJS92868.1 ABC transporter permease subunit [Salinisphaera sp. Q1T1-3]
MLSYTIKRLLGAIPTVFILLTLTFLLVHLAPGSPLDSDRPMPAQIRANLEAKYHLDEPLYEQYGHYLLNVAQFDFGASFQYKDTSVNDLIATGFPVSLAVGGFALLLALVFGIPLGMLAAVRQNRFADYAAMSGSLVGISVPNFVLGPLMILVLAVYNNWLPAGGLGGWQNYVMPVIALSVMYMAYVTRLMRASTIEVLRSPFIRTARAKGLSEARVFFVHVLPAAILPVISFLGPGAAAILTGSVVVEQIFGIPGLGRFFVTAALNRDYTLVLGITLFYGIIIIGFNLVVDILYGWLDPRVTY